MDAITIALILETLYYIVEVLNSTNSDWIEVSRDKDGLDGE